MNSLGRVKWELFPNIGIYDFTARTVSYYIIWGLFVKTSQIVFISFLYDL